MGLLLLFLANSALAQGTGYIQITCEPGVQVFLDGTFKGVTSKDLGGYVLSGVPAGLHLVKVV
ncbi:MAG: hypothetical protein ACKODH_06315, partial [Limisphaerales bacterium]